MFRLPVSVELSALPTMPPMFCGPVALAYLEMLNRLRFTVALVTLPMAQPALVSVADTGALI